MPSASPSATCTCTPSTALIQPRTLPTNTPRITGKYFLRPIPCSITMPSGLHRHGYPTLGQMAAGDGHGGWVGLRTEELSGGTPGGEGTTGREARQVWRLPTDLDELLALQLHARQTT